MEENYKVKAELGELKLCPETFMPQKTLWLDVTIKADAQHDGRLWPENYSRIEENELVERIMQRIRTHVEDAIRNVNPFSIHKH